MNNRQLHKLHQAALELFKSKGYQNYDPELRHIVAILEAYKMVAKNELDQQIPFELETRQIYESIDDF